MTGNFLVNDQGDFIIDHNDNFIELADGDSPDPGPTPVIPSGPGVVLLGTDYEAAVSNHLPTCTYYKYYLSEQIYTKDEIYHIGAITDISFYPVAFQISDATRNISIYLSLTNSTETESTSASVAEGTLVYSGDVHFVAGDWTKIRLSTQFEYNCTSNLRITVVDNTGEGSDGLDFRVYYTIPSKYASSYVNSDTTAFNPASSQYPVTTFDGRNLLMLTFEGDPSGNFVHIGEHDYPYVQIGNRLWTTVNLYEPLGSFGNTTGTDSCWVDFNTGSEKGMMYALRSMTEGATARTQLEAMLPTGWRLPTQDDFIDLKIAANTDWRKLTLPEYGGTNELGFNAQLMTPMATDHTSPSQYPPGENTVTKFVMVNSSPNNEFELYHVYSDEQFVMFYDNPAWRICIRVCKDV